ncbi:hypothetical protein CLU79DRAFT_761890 [Phycomyces nitens]|nr:hypothetical protein CLU79DRAFT_761890 [Phycomyces nitens]
MNISLFYGLMSLMVFLVSAAPQTSNGYSYGPYIEDSSSCLDLDYPTNGTIWRTHGSYNVTWTVTGKCQDTNYIYLLPVSRDEDGELSFGELYHLEESVDIESGKFNLTLDSREVKGNYLISIGPKVDDWSGYTDFAIININ